MQTQVKDTADDLFFEVLGSKKAADLLILAADAFRDDGRDPDAAPLTLFRRIYGECDGNEFTNEAVQLLAAIAVRRAAQIVGYMDRTK